MISVAIEVKSKECKYESLGFGGKYESIEDLLHYLIFQQDKFYKNESKNDINIEEIVINVFKHKFIDQEQFIMKNPKNLLEIYTFLIDKGYGDEYVI